MTSEQKTWADAQFDRYARSLAELMGPKYKEDPRYHEAVEKLLVNPSRGALNIVLDMRESRAHC